MMTLNCWPLVLCHVELSALGRYKNSVMQLKLHIFLTTIVKALMFDVSHTDVQRFGKALEEK